jgi:hypothetical protein
MSPFRSPWIFSFLLLSISGLLTASPCLAEFRVHAGSPDSPILIPEGSSAIELFVAAGADASADGTACLDGDGGELCAWKIDLEAVGDVQLTGFDPAAPGKTIWNLEGNRLRANGGDSANGTLDDAAIGILTVDRSGNGMIRFTSTASNVGVAADLELVPLGGSVVAVPEPLAGPALMTGLMFLALLSFARAPRNG